MIHLMLDGYVGNENRLDDLRTVNAVLNDLVFTLHLDCVMPPFLLPYYYAKDGEDDGISAFIILQGGHITLHTFPRRGCVFADLLYDGYASEDKFVDCLRTYFKFEDQRTLCTERRIYDSTLDSKRVWTGSDEGDFGPHIIAKIDDVETDMEQIFDMLDELPQKINMIPISRPYVIKSNNTDTKYISGIVLIAQSHIAFHYSAAEKKLFCDAFSCSFYKSEQFADYIEKKFGACEHLTLIRGSKHENKILSRSRKISKYSKWVDTALKGDKNGL